MELNSDFSQRVLLHGDAIAWTPSPMVGVDRRMLDRVGGEVARATSIVRYAAGSHFETHTHGGGEEFVVLEGVFQDERGDYPAGTYVRNPPGSRHRPGSAHGCVIFVKLWQFDPSDRVHLSTDTRALAPSDVFGRPGVAVAPLFDNTTESVCLESWAPDTTIELETPHGAEALVLDGSCVAYGEPMRAQSWLRLPVGSRLSTVAGPEGARVWMKIRQL